MRYKGKSLSLERKDPSQLGEILPQMLRIMHLSSGMDEQLVMRAWDKVTGAGSYTLSKSMKNGVLYCSISSSVVRNQLFYNRLAIVEAINNEVKADPLYNGRQGREPLKILILK